MAKDAQVTDISAVLLQSGWHEVKPGSGRTVRYRMLNDGSVYPGYAFTEASGGDLIVRGDSILGVRGVLKFAEPQEPAKARTVKYG